MSMLIFAASPVGLKLNRFKTYFFLLHQSSFLESFSHTLCFKINCSMKIHIPSVFRLPVYMHASLMRSLFFLSSTRGQTQHTCYLILKMQSHAWEATSLSPESESLYILWPHHECLTPNCPAVMINFIWQLKNLTVLNCFNLRSLEGAV